MQELKLIYKYLNSSSAARNPIPHFEHSRGFKLQGQKRRGLRAVRQFFQTIYQLRRRKPKYVYSI